MARSVASKVEQAADALDAFLRDQSAAVSAEPSQAVVPSEERDEAPGHDGGLPLRRQAKQAGPAAMEALAGAV